jgi:PH domain
MPPTQLDSPISPISSPDDIELQEQKSEMVSISLPTRNKRSKLPTAEDLLAEGPAKAGYCEKKNNSFLSYLLGDYFPIWFPKYKRRFFILIGNYLYRYSSESGTSPKGVPIPLDAVTVRRGSGEEEDSEEVDPCMFQVVTIRKVYTIRADNEEDCAEWIRAIIDRKAGAIRESMGHAKVSTKVMEFNKAGQTLFEETLKKDGSGSTFLPSSSLKDGLDYTRNPLSPSI